MVVKPVDIGENARYWYYSRPKSEDIKRLNISIDTRESIRLLMSYGRTEIPVVVINHVKVLDEQDITGKGSKRRSV